MASSKRRCATCRYFQDSGMSGNGWCTHPDRQVSSDVRILVRKAELACRNAWGSDLWVDANADESTTVAPRPPQPQQTVPTINVSYDDEVTSVVNSGENSPAPSSLDDEVVEQSTISFVDDYDEEQDERRDLLYRDSRSAIERARERHMQRRQHPVLPDEDTVISHGTEPNRTDVPSREEPAFEPDDFVEEEAPKPAQTADEDDDSLISEGVRTPTPRSLRLRRFRDDRPLPKKDPTATKTEPELDAVDLELPHSAAPDRGRFDSIPEISAEVDLPLLRRSSSANDHDNPVTPANSPDSVSYERALKRAHDLNATARRERDQERRHSNAPAPLRESPNLEVMPDLPEISSSDAGTDGYEMPVSPMGTSATLHPRVSVAPVQESENRVRTRPRPPVEQPRPQAGPRQPDARQSWWRGTRRTESTENLETPRPISRASATWLADPQPESSGAPEGAFDHQQPSVPERVTFDLGADEGMDSFRGRLFATAPVQDEAAATPRRTPISVARRQARSVSPTPEREPAQPGASERPPQERHHIEERHPAPARRREEVTLPTKQIHRVATHAQPRPAQIQPEMLLSDPRDAWYEPEPVRGFDVRALIDEDHELLDMTIEIAPEVPRVCVTCRNYRPSEQDGRGWCTNEWAFTHRQMVNETDLACDSTIGCWWLPADRETWLDEFEIAADATPRVDRLLAHLDPERQVVGN